MPLATRYDAFGRPIYGAADPNNPRPDDPLTKVIQNSAGTDQTAADLYDPNSAAIGNDTERHSAIDYSGFGNRTEAVQNQGKFATNQQQQSIQGAMQRRLQAAQNAQGSYSGFSMGPGVSTTDLRSRLVGSVASFEGTPYKWGGAAPGGFDCSGLVQYAYARIGVNMPRTSGQDAHLGVRMAINRLSPGDLVAHPGHIAVYAGNGMMWESPHTGAAVRLVPVRSDMYGIHLTLPGDSRGK